MQNKRWKRKAKRLKGTCINTSIKKCSTGICKCNDLCLELPIFSSPMGINIRELEKVFKGKDLKI